MLRLFFFKISGLNSFFSVSEISKGKLVPERKSRFLKNISIKTM